MDVVGFFWGSSEIKAMQKEVLFQRAPAQTGSCLYLPSFERESFHLQDLGFFCFFFWLVLPNIRNHFHQADGFISGSFVLWPTTGTTVT